MRREIHRSKTALLGHMRVLEGLKGYYEGLKTLLNAFKPSYSQLTAHILRVYIESLENPKKDDNIIRINTKYNINTYYP